MPLRVDVLARRWGGPDGGPDGMAVAAAFLAFTLAELGHSVRCYSGEAGAPSFTHPRVEWVRRVPLFAPDDWAADLTITTISGQWRRTAAAADLAGARGRLVYWHHHGLPPPGAACILAAPPAISAPDGWARSLVLPPSSWAAEAGGPAEGVEVLVPGAARAKGGDIALAVARACPDLRFYVLPGRGGAGDLAPWRRLRNVAVAAGHVAPAVFLARARAVLSPTRAEVHPLVLVEAGARGIPIVCTDLPATRAAAPDARHVAEDAPPDAWASALRSALAEPGARPALRPYREIVAEFLAALGPFPLPAAPSAPRRERPRVALRMASPPQRPAPSRPEPARPPAPAWRPRPLRGIPRVLVLADVPNWAWARKAAALKRHLAGRIDITVAYSSDAGPTDRLIHAQEHDLYHTFEVIQVGKIPEGWPLVTGITAHVAQTWDAQRGEGTVRRWADRAVGFHANSVMLQREMETYLGRPVYYVPNGVDETFFRRTRPRDAARLVVGHVARPNPRKGADLVRQACARAGVELRALDRSCRDALTAEEMRDWYQGIHVLAVSSDMDGTPNPALEAAACECAVVSNPIGNMPEFINHGVNGLVTERTVDSLAAALADLAARPLGDVEEMGRAARATILDSWTWATRATNYAEMWERCTPTS